MAVYTKTTWNTGDVITAAKMNNLETQHEKALELDNNQYLRAKEAGGTTLNLIGISSGDDVEVGQSSALLDDLNINTFRGINISFSGIGAAVTLDEADDDLNLNIGNLHIAKSDPLVKLDRDGGAGQYARIPVLDGATVHGEWAYDYTNNHFIKRDDVLGTIEKLERDTGFLLMEHRPRVRVYRSLTQVFTHATEAAFQFNQEDYDNDVIHDNSTNNSRLTCKTAGIYEVWGTCQWTATGGASPEGERRIRIKKNGSSYYAGQSESSEDIAFLSVYDQVTLAVNDYVELMGYCNTGNSEPTVANTQMFGMRMVGTT